MDGHDALALVPPADLLDRSLNVCQSKNACVAFSTLITNSSALSDLTNESLALFVEPLLATVPMLRDLASFGGSHGLNDILPTSCDV